jgi:hypothetical protein
MLPTIAGIVVVLIMLRGFSRNWTPLRWDRAVGL